jgi:ketosteroid isomerase-like protein
VVRAFFAATGRADITAATSLAEPDATVWHNIDLTDKPLAATLGQIEMLKRALDRYGYEDERYDTAGSSVVVVRHVLVAAVPGGVTVRAPVIARITLRDGRIARIEEYIDNATFAPVTEFLERRHMSA